MLIPNWLDLLLPKPAGAPVLAPGLHPYVWERGGVASRLHLRVDPDGAGMLVANGSEGAYLSAVGVLMADRVLRGQGDGAIKAAVRAAFRGATVGEVSDDLWQVRRLIDDLTTPGARFPVTRQRGATTAGGPRRLAAPLRACLEQGDPETGAVLLRKLWEAGVAHVTVLGEPAREAAEVVRLVECAQDLGMIAGLRGLASWWSEEVLRAAAQAGLDYLTVVVAGAEAQAHDALTIAGDLARVEAAWALCREQELCAVAQVPLTDASMFGIGETLRWVAARGAGHCEVFALACEDDGSEADRGGAIPARGLGQAAVMVSEAAEMLGIGVSWDPPVWHERAGGLGEAVRRGPRAGAEVSVRVRASGEVLPARGVGYCAGNLLSQEWATIWGAECFSLYRAEAGPPARCAGCPEVGFCDEGCLKDPATWSDDRAGGDGQ